LKFDQINMAGLHKKKRFRYIFIYVRLGIFLLLVQLSGHTAGKSAEHLKEASTNLYSSDQNSSVKNSEARLERESQNIRRPGTNS